MSENAAAEGSPQADTVAVPPEERLSDNYASIQILEGMPNLAARGLVYLTLLLLAAGVLYAALTPLDVTIRCQGVVQPQQVRRILAPQAGIVGDVLATPGQAVKKGQPLLQINAPGMAGVVVADADGIVLELPARDRGVAVRESDLLCVLQPENAGLKVELKVPNKDAGQLSGGMPLTVRLDAFPVAEYGVVAARIGEISPTAREDAQLGYVYTVSAALPQEFVSAHGKRFAIRPGMVVTGEIVVARRSMLSAMVQGLGE